MQLHLLSLLAACVISADKPAPATTGADTQTSAAGTDTGTGTDSGTDTDTDTTDTAPRTVEAQCALVCDRYAACGCEARCDAWCGSYIGWFICDPEIDALIACAASHPDPCTWGDEPWPDITCADEIMAFTSCSGNVFFPLPGVPEVCE